MIMEVGLCTRGKGCRSEAFCLCGGRSSKKDIITETGVTLEQVPRDQMSPPSCQVGRPREGSPTGRRSSVSKG